MYFVRAMLNAIRWKTDVARIVCCVDYRALLKESGGEGKGMKGLRKEGMKEKREGR
jgi:hypothetical protein